LLKLAGLTLDSTKLEKRLLLTICGLGVYLALAMPVFAQESYYWCYAQHPALSYFDHPPMVAWLIWLGTQVFGHGAWGIRIGSLLCSVGGVWAGLQLMRGFEAPAASRVAWLVLALVVPSLVALRFLTNPDPAVCGFWMMAMLALWRARDGHLLAWAAAGFLAGCALLSKYTAAFLAPAGVLVLLLDPAMRRQLLRIGPWLGLLVAVATFLPVLLWNFGNDFESFRFQTSGRWERAELGLRWLGELLGGQMLVLNPLVFVACIPATTWLWRRCRSRDVRAVWLLSFGLPLVAFLLINSLVVQVKLNWLVPAVQPLLLGVALWWGESETRQRRPVAVRLGLRAAVAFGSLLLLAPLIRLFPQHRGTTWTGWEEVASRAEHWEEQIDTLDGREGNVFFFAGDYRDAAQLTRHLVLRHRDAPDVDVLEPTLAQNVFGRVALQFDHWDDPCDRLGQDAVFVLTRPDMRQELAREVARRFDHMELVEHVESRRFGIKVLEADIYVCRNYFGPGG
jgi:dolichol-phosphate mannosyltransferase